MNFPLPIPDPLRRALAPGASVLLAASGGVDSSLALALLRELGCEVLCVTFKNFCYTEEVAVPDKACCSLEAIEDARRLARQFGARHWVSDVSETFESLVIDPFVAEYSIGRTPNPCLACNAQVRFPSLLRLAEQQGCQYVATGHYARVVTDLTPPYGRGGGGQASSDGQDGPVLAGHPALLRGVDGAKDQAYFLHRIDLATLPRVVFPLGWYTKQQVRAAARELGLPVAAKAESQEICFVPDGDRSFLFQDPAATTPGDIVDGEGRRLGRHRGLLHYTVGQRRGLGIAAPRRLYVVALDRSANQLVVGYVEELAVTRIDCDRFASSVPDFPERGPQPAFAPEVTARIRHRHVGVLVSGWRRDGESLSVTLAAPALGVAPGQDLVLYGGDVVLGGGRILATAATAEVAGAEEEEQGGS